MNIFLATPFTDKLDSHTGKADKAFENLIANLIEFLRQKGHSVVNALEREAWGEKLYSPEDAIELDFQGVMEADVLVAVIGEPASPGVQMELGVASTHKIPIICLYQKEQFVPYLVMGLNRLTATRYIVYNSLEDENERILQEVEQLHKECLESSSMLTL